MEQVTLLVVRFRIYSTHPEITRYFMTVPEAAQLVLQAGTMGNGGEIFILKMGTPVRIANMARDMIRLSGFEPEVNIPIKYIGMRPGEKLYEELITEGEGIKRTYHEKIMVLHCNNGLCLEEADEHIKALVDLAKVCDAEGIKRALKRIVPEYQPWTGQDQIGEAEPPRICGLTKMVHVTGERVFTVQTGPSAEPITTAAGGRQTQLKLD